MLFYEMVKFKIFPNFVTFSILVDALCKEGQIDDAEHLVLMSSLREVIILIQLV